MSASVTIWRAATGQETVTNIDCLRLHHTNFYAFSCLLHVSFSLFNLSLQIINLQLGCLDRITAPNLSRLRLIRNSMYWLLLLRLEVVDDWSNFCLHKARVSRQEGKLRSVKHLLFFFNLPLQVLQTVAVKRNKSHILSSHSLSFLAEHEELRMDRLLQVS